MSELPNPTVDAIYASYKRDEKPRDYLGASEIGELCERRLWYQFRQVHTEQFSGRMLRLFESGNIEEDRIIADLLRSGCEVHYLDENGQQFSVEACNGHLRGHMDGVVEGVKEAPKTPHLLEVKTCNQKAFDSMEKNGVEKAKPKHYAQMQVYMHLAELKRALYVVVNKNTDEIYAERVEYDYDVARGLILKAQRIIDAETPPEKISQDPDNFNCRFCPFKEHCHGQKVANVSCRTCVHAAPSDGGKWSCSKSLPMETDCTEHLFIPDLVTIGKPLSGSPEHVVYEMVDKQRFANIAGACFPMPEMPCFSSSEIKAIDPKAIGNEAVEMSRKILGGKVVD